MQSDLQKFKATIVGPNKLDGYSKYLFTIKASRPFGSISIYENELIISSFFFKTKINKSDIISIKKREGDRGIEIIYLKNNVKMRILCSVKDNTLLNDFLETKGYSLTL